ncbi:hypothetical protein P168DRAFT_322602 [Aspergillus campestris IBT 28561]|uniref:Peptidase metallopeptidase domain-containing protein n=1 Tax=Aspergillus campestris (strain IBT 28561) TaxID=1392248 RepID=A0A2I1CR88_ASPC2|nr:uncharacterized protein P168DRAFT_322602 [Aspergillus campestris IBT 28561]PKY00151.1 hypothetical protein P168DRAFT_322602 [Aspergillus campestris IBT 28561]
MTFQMLWKIVLLLLFTLSLSCVANAGSAAWETARFPNAKWVGMEHTEKNMRWDRRTIKYSFSDPASRETLSTWVQTAMDLWYASGLPETFKVEEIDRRDCQRDGLNCLIITRSFMELSTPIGKKPHPDFHSLVARWTTETSVGMLDTGANFAHELGHAFGLYHESHNPHFWAAGGNLWNNYELNCPNFQGYDELSDELSFEMMWGEHGACEDGCTARRHKFRAAEVLPCLDDNIIKPGSGVTTDLDVDWSSIMTTPSYIGNGRNPLEDNTHYTVVRSLGNRRIDPTFAPTTFDVQGLITMYEEPYLTPRPILHNDPRSSAYGIFQRSAPGC